MTILLQHCTACGTRQYPERDLCRACLADTLGYAEDSGRGRLAAETTLHHTLDPAMAPELPMRIGMIALDAGVRVIAILGADLAAGDAVVLRTESLGGQSIFIADKEQAP